MLKLKHTTNYNRKDLPFGESGGSCFGLSCCWLQNMFYFRTNLLNTVGTNLDGMAYQNYADSLPGSGKSRHISMSAFCEFEHIRFGHLFNFKPNLNDVPDDDGLLFVLISSDPDDDPHSVAAYKSDETGTFYYDPNFGLYVLEGKVTRMNEITAQLRKCYGSKYKLDVDEILLSQVRPKKCVADNPFEYFKTQSRQPSIGMQKFANEWKNKHYIQKNQAKCREDVISSFQIKTLSMKKELSQLQLEVDIDAFFEFSEALKSLDKNAWKRFLESEKDSLSNTNDMFSPNKLKMDRIAVITKWLKLYDTSEE
jgi:hypothetical protein